MVAAACRDILGMEVFLERGSFSNGDVPLGIVQALKIPADQALEDYDAVYTSYLANVLSRHASLRISTSRGRA